MSDDPKAGMEWAAGQWAATQQRIQAFTSEIAEMSKQSYDHAMQTMERLRGAKSLEDLLSIQSGFVKESFESLGQRSRKLTEMMSAMPMEMANTYRETMMKAAETAMQTTRKATEKFQEAASKMMDNMPKP
jgi:hypothetical protein